MTVASGEFSADGLTGRADQPRVGQLVLIFWGMFAASVAISGFLNPGFFTREDPDSLMRLVQVRDLLAGQPWFDLVQHRLDPPAGASMHWSRLIDAPIAGLFLAGDLFGGGETFALFAWPLLVLLAFMAAAAWIGAELGGRAAVPPTLLLLLVFFDPLLSFLPGDLDHHNAQLAILLATVLATLRMPRSPAWGLAAGFLCALSLAIGLEMLLAIAATGAAVALRWAARGRDGRPAAAFGAGFGAALAPLYYLAGAPGYPMACDAISWAYIVPGAVAGLGLAGAISVCDRTGAAVRERLFGLAFVAAAAALAVGLIAPECLAGPYGALSPELKRVWLSTVTEAYPLLSYAAHEPVSAVANVGPATVALAVALRRLWRGRPGERSVWVLPALLIALALGAAFYQVRTLGVANAAAIPVLGAWLAGIAARHHVSGVRSLLTSRPTVLAALFAIPLVHLAIGWAAVETASLVSGGRMVPIERPDTPKHLTEGLSEAERLCLDPGSVNLLASVPTGIVMAPVFYGPALLAISGHSAVAGPYHRAGAAILDTIGAMNLRPDEAREVVARRGADYVAICMTARETALTAAEAPDGLLSQLVAGGTIRWLAPISVGGTPTRLRLWRVLD